MNNNSLVLTRVYEDRALSFDLTQGCMINANQMARVFSADIHNFLRTESTQVLIEAIVKDENQRHFQEFQASDLRFETSALTREDVVKVVHGGRNNGTWMHRLLAIEFAGWLDVKFKIWMLRTIEEILYGKKDNSSKKEDQEEAKLVLENEARRLFLHKKFDDLPEYQEMLNLDQKRNSYLKKVKKRAESDFNELCSNQVLLF